MGINFADDSEANEAYHIILEKAAKRSGSRNTGKGNAANGGLYVRPLGNRENRIPAGHRGNTGIEERDRPMGNVPIGHSRVNLSASTTSIDSGVSVTNKKQGTECKLHAACIREIMHLEKKNVGKRGGLSKADIGAPVANTFKHLKHSKLFSSTFKHF